MLPFAILGLGPVEFILIVVLILALFAPSLLPKIAKRLGQSISSIRNLADSDEEKGPNEKNQK